MSRRQQFSEHQGPGAIRRSQLIGCVALLLLGGATMSATPAERAQWFQVEVVLFEQPAPPSPPEPEPEIGESATLAANAVDPGDTIGSDAPAAPDPWQFDAPYPLPHDVVWLRQGTPAARNLGQLIALTETPVGSPGAHVRNPNVDVATDATADWALALSRRANASARTGVPLADTQQWLDEPARITNQASGPFGDEPARNQPTGQPSSQPTGRRGATSLISRWVEEPDEIETVESAVPIPATEALTAVPSAQWVLRDDATRLRRAGYRPFLHRAWRMPLTASAQPISVLLEGADGGPAGSLSIERRRFLHAHLRGALEGPGGRWARLDQQRRMRSNETHLFEQERLGALIRIERWPFPPADSQP